MRMEEKCRDSIRAKTRAGGWMGGVWRLGLEGGIGMWMEDGIWGRERVGKQMEAARDEGWGLEASRVELGTESRLWDGGWMPMQF